MTLNIGDKVLVKPEHTYDHHFNGGDVVVYTGDDIQTHHRGYWRQFSREADGFKQYMLEEHYEKSKPVEIVRVVTPIDHKLVVVDKTLPAKALYAVIKANGKISYTGEDRDTAREVKAALGGKKKGVRIISYLAEKEIR